MVVVARLASHLATLQLHNMMESNDNVDIELWVRSMASEALHRQQLQFVYFAARIGSRLKVEVDEADG